MNSKIDGIGSAIGGARLEPQVRRPGSPGQESVGAVSAAAPLRLDDDSVQLSAGASLGSAPGIDTARVESLRAQIESGRYTVDPQAVAARLLDIEGSLK